MKNLKNALILCTMLCCAASAQTTSAKRIDLSDPLADARLGLAWNIDGARLAVAYVPVVYVVGSSSKREYFTLNLGASSTLSHGKSNYLVSAGARVDTIFAKLGESSFAQKYLRFAVLPPLQISPTLLTADFKHFQWYLTIATKFGGTN